MKNLPPELIEYHKSGKPAYGFTDLDFGGYFHLEPIERIEELNREIEIANYAPGFTAFASDGGGEVFVFDDEGRIYLMPLIGMEPNAAVKVADSWADFETHIEPEPNNKGSSRACSDLNHG